MKQLVLIDGHSLAYRMYFALERTGMKTSKKEPTWAIFGFFKALFELLGRVQPDGIAVAFDMGRITFRNEIYPDYKAHRDEMPDDMRQQMAAIREGVELLGIPVFGVEHFEADDVIGTLARQAAEDGVNVVILTGDQDAFQIIDEAGRISLLVPSFKGGLSEYDRQKVFEKWGVYPEQVTDFKGLKGDPSDNIPGVPGVGDKTAAKLLADYKNLENVLAHVDQINGAKLKERLIQFKEQALMSKALATIRYDVPVTFGKDACRLAMEDEAAFKAFMTRHEFRSFLTQWPEWRKFFVTGAATASVDELAPVAEAGSPALPTLINDAVAFDVVTDQKALAAVCKAIEKAGVFAFDYETSGLNPRQNELAGVSLSWSGQLKAKAIKPKNILNLSHYPDKVVTLINGKSPAKPADIKTVYVPIRHPELDQCLDEALVFECLGPLLADASVVKIAHNAKFEINQSRASGQTLNGLVFDTMVASYVHNPNTKHNLKGLCFEWLGTLMQEITELIGKGKKQISFTQVPLSEAARYAAADAYVTLQLAAMFVEALDDDRKALLYELELPLVSVLAEMEWLGISVDTDYLATISQKLEKQLAKVEKAIYKEAGCEFNLNSPKQVGEVFFEKMGIPHKGKTKTGYSTNAKVLEQLAGEWPVVKKLLEYRQLFKLKSTYVDVLPELVDVTDNRLHSSFNQTITATGRLSSSDPNMQNIPIRTELGRSIRHAFVPAYRDHWCMLSADYSQIELRLLAHFSQDPILLEAFNKGQDIHAATAARVFGVPLEAVTKEQRYRAKAVNFGIIYGQTAYGLSQALDIFPGEAAEFIERYFSTYPRVKSYIDEVVAEAHKTGVATTLFGRVRDLSADLNDKTRFIREFAERAAFNTPLQGSAADIMKVAMIRCHQALKRERLESKLILQVHDEMVLEVFNPEKERVIELVRTAMGLDQPLRVPLVVDVSIGPTWMDVEDIVDDTGGATKASGGAMTLGLTLEAGVGVS